MFDISDFDISEIFFMSYFPREFEIYKSIQSMLCYDIKEIQVVTTNENF